MDKLLITGLLSLIAAFITSVISIVKLVIEKEHRTSEFRQEWTTSLRNCISELAAKASSTTVAMSYQIRLMIIEEKLEERLEVKDSDVTRQRLAHIRTALLAIRAELTACSNDFQKYTALVKLHFKPDDFDALEIEKIITKIIDVNRNIYDIVDNSERDDNEIERLRLANLGRVSAIHEVGRKILKQEWERVKTGEKSFIQTKRIAVMGSLVTLVFIILLTGYTSNVLMREESLTALATPKITTNTKTIRNIPTDCWRLESINNAIIKFNVCNGQHAFIEQSVIKRNTQLDTKTQH